MVSKPENESNYLVVKSEEKCFTVRFSDHPIPWRYDENGKVICKRGVASKGVDIDYYYDRSHKGRRYSVFFVKKIIMQFFFGGVLFNVQKGEKP